MKFSTCMTVVAFTLAMVSAGCRYDKSAGDGLEGEAEGTEVGAGATDLSADIDTTDMEGGSLSDLAGLDAAGAGEWPGYTRCADVAFAPVYFQLDSTTIAPAELVKVEDVARHLADNADRVVTIEGNCDERGSNEYNLSLGEDRATIIANFLAQNGVAQSRIKTVSRGETNPAVEGTGEGVWAQNRRGEFIIWKK